MGASWGGVAVQVQGVYRFVFGWTSQWLHADGAGGGEGREAGGEAGGARGARRAWRVRGEGGHSERSCQAAAPTPPQGNGGGRYVCTTAVVSFFPPFFSSVPLRLCSWALGGRGRPRPTLLRRCATPAPAPRTSSPPPRRNPCVVGEYPAPPPLSFVGVSLGNEPAPHTPPPLPFSPKPLGRHARRGEGSAVNGGVTPGTDPDRPPPPPHPPPPRPVSRGAVSSSWSTTPSPSHPPPLPSPVARKWTVSAGGGGRHPPHGWGCFVSLSPRVAGFPPSLSPLCPCAGARPPACGWQTRHPAHATSGGRGLVRGTSRGFCLGAVGVRDEG